MPSDFFGLHVGLSALNAARRQMEVAAQNVSNANTDGYSRQRVEIAATGAATVAAVHARSDGSGSGVSVVGVYRTTDEFLAARSLREHSTQSSLQRSQTILGRLELTFNEPSDTGIQAQLADFWAGWEDVSNSPGNLASRSQLIQRATTLAASVNQATNDMGELWKSSVEQLQTVITGVNASADRVAELNDSIKRATAAGLNPNALMDQRDRLAKTLAQQVGGEVRKAPLGQVDVFVGGTALVRGIESNHLRVNLNGSNVALASTNPVLVEWAKDSFPATVTGGEAAGLLDGVNRMIPQYRTALIGTGPTAASVTGPAAGIAAASVSTDFAAAPASFQVTLKGVTSTVTLDTDLSAGATPSSLQNALNAALGTAGVTGVAAKVTANAGNLVVSFASLETGPGATLTVAPGPLANALLSAAPTVTAGASSPTGTMSLAAQLTSVVNSRHLQGKDLNGAAGQDFFTFDSIDGLRLAVTSPESLAVAGAGKPKFDGSNGLSLADVGNASGGPDNTYRSFVITLGVETQTANRRVEIQNDITKQVDGALDSAAGVSIDEEMASMVAYQHTYNAAARVITAIDGMLEKLINGTGLVGR